MNSPSGSINWDDLCKAAKAFAYNLVSLTVPVTAFLIMVPKEQVPPSFLWLVASAPFINGLAVVIIRWAKDNRK